MIQSVVMKRILFTLLMAVVLMVGIAVECAEAGKRKYNIKNCDRSKVWKKILSNIHWDNPNLEKFIEKNIEPVNIDPQLNDDDYLTLEKFDKKLHWHVSECLLLMKEINVLVKSVHEKDPEKTFFIAMSINGAIVSLDIPFLWNSKSVNDLVVFSFNLSPFLPEAPF